MGSLVAAFVILSVAPSSGPWSIVAGLAVGILFVVSVMSAARWR
jgi:hypothetical protein